MQYGAHLPLIDFAGRQQPESLTTLARAAADLGFRALAANDHLAYGRPWLDGIVALASVIEASRDLALATTAALPVIRGAVPLARAASALELLSDGRLRLGVAPGSSRADYDLVGIEFSERWRRFDESVAVLRDQDPNRPIWIASWGSPAGLRRVARLGDGWLASAYNTSPAQVVAGRARLRQERIRLGRLDTELPCTVATMWTRITHRSAEWTEALGLLAQLLDRPRDVLADRLLIGPPEHCAEIVRDYAAAGVDLLCLWPVGDSRVQLERFMTEVVPQVQNDPTGVGGR